MGILGDLLAAPIKVVNAPVRALEDLFDCDNEDDRLLSKPLDAIAEELKKVDE